jgi:hypothetical protein
VGLRSRLEALSRFDGKSPAFRGLPLDPSTLLSLCEVTKFSTMWASFSEGRHPPVRHIDVTMEYFGITDILIRARPARHRLMIEDEATLAHCCTSSQRGLESPAAPSTPYSCAMKKHGIDDVTHTYY